jgi:hypothetical protein
LEGRILLVEFTGSKILKVASAEGVGFLERIL